MIIKQISIFIENRKGRLAEVTEFLGKNNINIRGLTISDTTDFGILRIIVDEPEKVVALLTDNNITASVTTVLSIGINNDPGELSKALRLLADNDMTVEYMYDYAAVKSEKSYVIMRIDGVEEAQKILNAAGIDA